MKDIKEYPTPITDFVFAGWIESHPARLSHAKLERKLAACREALGIYADRENHPTSQVDGYLLAQQTLAATEP